MSKVRNRIRRLRFEHGEMTQEELASRAGCTRQTIIALEQGKYVPSLELAFKIATAFGAKLAHRGREAGERVQFLAHLVGRERDEVDLDVRRGQARIGLEERAGRAGGGK